MRGNKEVFRDRVLELPDVEGVYFSSTVFSRIEGLDSQEIDGKVFNFSSVLVDAEFIDLYDIKLSEGHLFLR